MSLDQLSEEQIFEQAFQLQSPKSRRAFLLEVCRDKQQIERVEALLKAGAPEASFLENGPAVLQEPNNRPPDLPERIGDFEILGELGRGGMGVVYRARQCSLNRLVALKVLSTGLALTTKAIMRFKLEAEAAAKLHHTNIVPIYWTGEENRVPYYAMELIDGPSLDQVIKQRRAEDSGENNDARDSSDQHVPDWVKETLIYSSPPATKSATETDTSSLDSSSSLRTDSSYYDNLAKMIAGVADALAHAHDHGIVHRDIKPANLLLSADGRLSVNDFGLARMLEQPGMTMTGEFMGSPMYMSPEQITAGRLPLDHRTDIYSLGASLYELLTLTPPFPGKQRDQVLTQVMHKDPPKPRSINPRIPRDLETICLKAMEKDPDRRYQTAELLAEDLRRFVNRYAISARRVSPLEKGVRWIRKNKAISAMACLVLMVTLGSIGYVSLQNRTHQRDLTLNDALEKAMSGQFEDAKEHIATAISYGADKHWRPMIDAQQNMFVGDASEAVESLENIVDRDDENLTAQWMLANAYAADGQWVPYVYKVGELGDRYPHRPEERMFSAAALQFLDPDKSINLLREVVAEKPELVYARDRLALALVFKAIDTKGGDSTFADEALDEVRTSAGVLRQENNPCLASTRLYAHVTKAFLEYVREDQPAAAKAYLEENAKTDVDILAKYPQYLYGNFTRLYYFQFTEDFDGMYAVMKNVIDNRHGGWVSDPFWVTCFIEPEWAEWDSSWEYKNPLEMLQRLPRDYQLNLSRSIFRSTFMSSDDSSVEATAKDKLSELKDVSDVKDDLRGDFSEQRYFASWIRYAARQINEDQFIKAAGNSERKLATAYFTIGMTKLQQGYRNPGKAKDYRDEAKDYFDKSAQGTMYHWTTYNWSRAFLDRMNKDPEWPRRPNTPIAPEAPD